MKLLGRLIAVGLFFVTSSALAAWGPVAEEIIKGLEESQGLYAAGKGEEAQQRVRKSYFDVFEGGKMEGAMKKSLGGEHTEGVEKSFGQIRKAYKNGAKAEEVAAMVKKLSETLRTDAGKMDAANTKNAK